MFGQSFVVLSYKACVSPRLRMKLALVFCLFFVWVSAIPNPAMFMADGQPDRRNLSKALILQDEDDEDNEIGGDFLALQLKSFGDKIFGEPDHRTGKRLEAWNADSNINPEELGTYIEGDILFPSNQQAARNGLKDANFRWPGGDVPYEISYSFSQRDRDTILSAMQIYRTQTCIRFRPKEIRDRDYIYITNGATGCWSSVGRIGGRQEVNLQSPGCLTKIGTVIHELMHAVGFLHEQNREDRDNHVTIKWDNIQSGREVNFKKAAPQTTDAQGQTYDYGSVMHYSSKAFSKNNRDTIIPRIGKYELGQRNGFSTMDVKKIRKMYGC